MPPAILYTIWQILPENYSLQIKMRRKVLFLEIVASGIRIKIFSICGFLHHRPM